MKKIQFYCLITTLFLSPCVTGQNLVNQLDSLAGNTIKALRQEKKEKILLQTNRKVFAVGEKIWFRAILVDSLNNRLDSSSKNLFVDLVNDKDSVIKQLVLNATAQRTDGAVQLNESLATGYYWMRGYTQNILNSAPESIALQPLYIINDKKTIPDAGQPFAKSQVLPEVAFYPEGGSLVAGLNSTGVLVVKDQNGKPILAEGYVIDNKDTIVTRFTTNRFGIAKVSFYPKWFQKYQAVVVIGEKLVRCNITPWNPLAAQISVIKQTQDYLETQINLEDSIYTRKYTTYIVGISKDSVCFAGIGRGMCKVSIPTADFPGGIATLLLFNEEKQLVSERDVYINKDNFTLGLTTDKTNYKAREKATLQLDVRDTKGNPLMATLTVSVEDDRAMRMSDMMETENFQPVGLSLNDWLTKNKATMTDEELDLLMLAQPPFYKNLRLDTIYPAFNDNNYLLQHLKGTVADTKGRILEKRVVTEITKLENNTFFDVDTTGIGGGFSLSLPDNTDNMLLMLQITNNHGIVETDDKIKVDTFSFPKFNTPVELKNKLTVNPTLPIVTRNFHIDTVLVGTGKEWLQSVTVKTKSKKLATYNTSKRVSEFSHIITSEMMKSGGYGSVGNLVLMVPGVAIKGGYLAVLGGFGFGSSSKTEPLVVMDGVIVPMDASGDASPNAQGELVPILNVGFKSPVLQFLSTLSSSDIDFVEVLSGPEAAAFGMQGGNGVIVVNTKTNGVLVNNGPNGIKMIAPKTYHKAPVFKTPDYSVKEAKNSLEPDNRNSLYWNGNVLTNTNGSAMVNFYTADVKTTYSVVVTGITAKGDYVYKRFAINRK